MKISTTQIKKGRPCVCIYIPSKRMELISLGQSGFKAVLKQCASVPEQPGLTIQFVSKSCKYCFHSNFDEHICMQILLQQDRVVNDASFSHFFNFHFFHFIFLLTDEWTRLLPLPRSFLLVVAPSSLPLLSSHCSFLIPLCCSFLLVTPSSSLLLASSSLHLPLYSFLIQKLQIALFQRI